MDAPHDRMKSRNPGPWRFYVRRYGLVHVIADANGSPMASSVPIGSDPLLAAGPELLSALQRVAELAPAGSPAHTVAVDALEQFVEREGMTLADWQPVTAPAVRPQLRIAGVATYWPVILHTNRLPGSTTRRLNDGSANLQQCATKTPLLRGRRPHRPLDRHTRAAAAQDPCGRILEQWRRRRHLE
ncbi:MAG: hypothetical protein WKH97_12320 [Casimicrobiaceae bacterium]